MDYSHIRKKTQISHIFDPLYKISPHFDRLYGVHSFSFEMTRMTPLTSQNPARERGTDTRDSERHENSAAGSVWSRPEVIFAKAADRAKSLTSAAIDLADLVSLKVRVRVVRKILTSKYKVTEATQA